MRPFRQTCLFLLCALPSLCQGAAPAKSILDTLAIEIRGLSREFAYTNKRATYFYGQTNAETTNSWQGLNTYGHKYLDDYALLVNGKALAKSTALKVEVFPDHLVRTYPGGLTEQVTLIDSVDALLVVLSSPRPVEVAVVPLVSDGRDAADYDVVLRTSAALIARRNHPARTSAEDFPVWLAVHGPGMLPRSTPSTRGRRSAR